VLDLCRVVLCNLQWSRRKLSIGQSGTANAPKGSTRPAANTSDGRLTSVVPLLAFGGPGAAGLSVAWLWVVPEAVVVMVVSDRPR